MVEKNIFNIFLFKIEFFRAEYIALCFHFSIFASLLKRLQNFSFVIVFN